LGNHCTREHRILEFKAVVRFILITFLYLRMLVGGYNHKCVFILVRVVR
jgi:hypothetical protein